MAGTEMRVFRPDPVARGVAAVRAGLGTLLPGFVVVVLALGSGWPAALGLSMVVALAVLLAVRSARIRIEVEGGRLRVVNAVRSHVVGVSDVESVVAGRHLLLFGCLVFCAVDGRRIKAAATELNGTVWSLDRKAAEVQEWVERELPTVERRYRSIPIGP